MTDYIIQFQHIDGGDGHLESLMVVMWQFGVLTAVMWQLRIFNSSDVVHVVAGGWWQLLSTSTPSLGLCRHLQGAAAMMAGGGCSKEVMGQCLAMGGCQTLRL